MEFQDNVNDIIDSFERFIAQKKVTGTGKEFTHTRVGKPGGSYYIKDGFENQNFLNHYCKILKLKKEKNIKYDLNFSEKQKNVGPLMTDYDFEFNNSIINFDETKLKDYEIHKYTLEDIKTIVRVINDLIYKNFDIDKEYIVAYVTEKKHATIKYDSSGNFKCIKDGFHICYILPFKAKQRKIIYNEVKTFFANGNKLGHIGFTNSYDNVFDESTIERNNWMMYGSYKTIDRNHYVYTNTYAFDFNGDKKTNEYDRYDLVSYFSVRQYSDDDAYEFRSESKYANIDDVSEHHNIRSNAITDDIIITLNNKTDENTDIIMDDIIITSNKKTEQDLENFENKPSLKYNDIHSNSLIFANDKEKYKNLASCLLDILNPSRCDNYSDWIIIGWALKSIDDSMYKIYDEFSKKSKKYTSGCCLRIWKNARMSGNIVTIGTLKHMAFIDDPLRYHEIIHKFEIKTFTDSLSGNDVDIAKYVYEKYNHMFVCSSIKNKIWYIFKNHHWVETEQGKELRDKITTDITEEFKNAWRYEARRLNQLLKDQRDQLLDNGEISINSEEEQMIKQQRKKQLTDYTHKITSVEKKRNQYVNIIKKLNNHSSLTNIMNSCCFEFKNDKFENQLDLNSYLIGFNNGVYDLNKMIFRPGFPEDYVSMSVGYDYVEYSGNEKEFEKINKYFEDLQQDVQIREYILRYLASRLKGENKEQFLIWTGKGNNGKSVFTVLLNKVFGDYYGTLEHTVITQKRSPNASATPDLANTKGKRIVTVAEPDANDTIKVSFVKQLSGGRDKVTARKLFRDPIQFIPQYELILICNMPPVLNNIDGGIVRRMSVVEFSTTFVPHAPIHSNQIQMNPKIAEFINSGYWSPYIMWLLINKYYREYDKYGLQPPQKVQYSTANYIKNSDSCREFFDEHYIETTTCEPEVPICFSEVYNKFKNWFKAQSSDHVPTRNKFREYIIHNTNIKIGPTGELSGIIEKNDETSTETVDEHIENDNK